MGNIIAAIAVLGALGALFGLILSVASKIFEVKKDPREEAILSHLAGANCGGCGFAGCSAYAEAVFKGEAPIGKCASGGNECAKAIIQSGINEVIYISDKYADSDATLASKRMLASAGVKLTRFASNKTITISFDEKEV